MNIYLIGMPGCGKSTIGNKLALKINYNYIDLDKYIEEISGLSIPLIFEKYGESRFRELETEALNRVSNLNNTIISCGGGIIGNLENKNLMNGKCIYINVDIKELETRILNDKVNIRPMFNNNSVIDLYNKRKDKYEYFKDYEVINNNIDTCVYDIIKVLDL